MTDLPRVSGMKTADAEDWLKRLKIYEANRRNIDYFTLEQRNYKQAAMIMERDLRIAIYTAFIEEHELQRCYEDWKSRRQRQARHGAIKRLADSKWVRHE